MAHTDQRTRKAPERERTALATSKEVAAYLRTTPAGLRMLRLRGTAPKGSRAGRTWLYRWEDVDAWLEQRAS